MAGIVNDGIADRNQFPADMRLMDGGGVIRGLCDADHAIGKLSQIFLGIGIGEIILGREKGFQRHRIRQLAALNET